jgi:hypothetical protein
MWSTSRRLFLAGIGLQLLAGAALAGQLVVVKAVLTEVLRGDQGPDLGRLLPHLAAASVATALVMVAGVGQRAVGRMQLELAALRTQHLVFEAANRAELSAFEARFVRDLEQLLRDS